MNESKLRKGTKYVSIKDEDVHTVTGALKQFFRELKTELIPIEIVRRLPDNLGEFDDFDVLSNSQLIHYSTTESPESVLKIREEMLKIDYLPRESLKHILKHLIL